MSNSLGDAEEKDLEKERSSKPDPESVEPPGLRRVVRWVATLNLSYFGIEFAVALAIGSVSLFADSIDFLEDTTLNLLVLVSIGWRLRRRSVVGMVLAAILLAPGVATVWTAVMKLREPVAPEAIPLSVAGAGALAVNFVCAMALVRFRCEGGSLTRAAFLSARNDVMANIGIIAAGVLTAATLTPWPDLVVGLGIFLINAKASVEVYGAARRERSLAVAEP